MSNLLPQRFKDEVLSMPEYRQGTNRISVRLKDGRVYSAVYVAWGDEIVRVGDLRHIPFSGEDVASVANDL